jgi:hypothetical protein
MDNFKNPQGFYTEIVVSNDSPLEDQSLGETKILYKSICSSVEKAPLSKYQYDINCKNLTPRDLICISFKMP